jgi:hypothetical protein
MGRGREGRSCWCDGDVFSSSKGRRNVNAAYFARASFNLKRGMLALLFVGAKTVVSCLILVGACLVLNML